MSKQPSFNVLVFSKTSGYRHTSIPAGIAAIQAIADHSRLFTVQMSEDAEEAITPSSLAKYAAVVLLQCTGTFLNATQIGALKGFVRAGGGVVGIHGAAAGMLEDPWYASLIGAHFNSHPSPEYGRVIVEDAIHPITHAARIPDPHMDEWYNFRTHPRDNKNLHILLKGDTKSFKGSKHGEDHPLSWCQDFEGGRSWYTALGHFDEAYQNPWFVDQMERAILWVTGLERLVKGA
jgi:type 1 glutamine amidotransferase